VKKHRYVLKLLGRDAVVGDSKTVLVTGFQGFGGVGYLTARYMVSKLGMKLIGYIEPPNIPDFTSVEDYGLSMPHEIFFRNVKGINVIVLLNRVNPDRKYLSSFVQSVINLIKDLNIQEVYLVGGLDMRFREGNEEFRWVKTRAMSDIKIFNPYFVKGAYVVGPLAALLLEFEHRNIPAIAVFPYTEPESIDHRAAAVAVKVLSEILGLEVDISELIKYAEKVEELEKSIQEALLNTERKESVMHT